MSEFIVQSFFNVVKSLWKRAPIWRFTLIAGVVCTFVLVVLLISHSKKDNKKDNLYKNVFEEVIYNPSLITKQNTPSQIVNSFASNPDMNKGSEFDSAVLGKIYSGSIQINGFKLLLPEGQWVIFANEGDPLKTSYFLGRVVGRKLIGSIVAHAVRPDYEFGEVSALAIAESVCSNENNVLYMHKKSLNVNIYDIASCWIMHNVFTSAMRNWDNISTEMDSLIRAAAENMASKGISYPQDFVAIQFIKSEKWGILAADYSFSPDNEKIKSNEVRVIIQSDWSPGNIENFPEKLAYVEKLKTWGKSFWPQFSKAFYESKN